MRATVGTAKQSMLPQAIGLCAADTPRICQYINRATQSLINTGGETGWVGGWHKVVFQVRCRYPYITLPREYSRIINMDVCRTPIRINNPFYEFLEAGVGLQDFKGRPNWCGALAGYERGNFPTLVDLTPTNQLLRVYITDARDVNSRILVGPCLDQNGNNIYSQDGQQPVNGFYLQFAQPFTTSDFIVTNIGGIQKDVTFGDVLLYQVDATTGTEVLLSRYAPDETMPAYRRYFINQLPNGCCTFPPVNPCLQQPEERLTQVTAQCKLDFVPVSKDTDFLIIGNIPALIEECKSIRYSDMDADTAPALQAKSHNRAIKMLNDELGSYIGKYNIAVLVAPFGTAYLGRPMAAVRFG